MLGLINWRLKVTINDGRAFIGQMLAFDKHMNLVLADCEEFRHVRPKKKQGESEAGPEQEMKRSLGLVILRGETVVSLSVEGPPPVQDEDKKNAVCATSNSREVHLNLSFLRASQLPAGPGRGMPAGRGMGMVPPCACCILALRSSIEGDCHLLLHLLYSNSRPPGICETPDAIRATWHARRTSRFPPSRISAGRAIPPSSWVRWPSSRVRRSPGMFNG
jgi:small nuclear ribonucleoprotein (snRNP)-like protein